MRSFRLLLSFSVPLAAGWVLVEMGRARQPLALDLSRRFAELSLELPFGTDSLGRDMFGRVLLASGTALVGLFFSLSVSAVLGIAFGAMIGWKAGTLVDRGVSFAIDSVFVVPTLLVLLALFTVIEPTTYGIYLALGVIGAAGPARVVRNEVVRLKDSPFVLSQLALGFPPWRIAATSLPLIAASGLQSMTAYVPELLGYEVGLGFFGLGAPPPTPVLGRLLYEGITQNVAAWWLLVFPAAATALVALALRETLLATPGERR